MPRMPPTLKIFEVQNRNNIFRHTGDVVQLVVSNGFQSLDRYHRSCRTPKNRAKTLTTKDKRSLVYLQQKCHNFSFYAAFRHPNSPKKVLRPPLAGKFRRTHPQRWLDGDGDQVEMDDHATHTACRRGRCGARGIPRRGSITSTNSCCGFAPSRKTEHY